MAAVAFVAFVATPVAGQDAQVEAQQLPEITVTAEDPLLLFPPSGPPPGFPQAEIEIPAAVAPTPAVTPAGIELGSAGGIQTPTGAQVLLDLADRAELDKGGGEAGGAPVAPGAPGSATAAGADAGEGSAVGLDVGASLARSRFGAHLGGRLITPSLVAGAVVALDLASPAAVGEGASAHEASLLADLRSGRLETTAAGWATFAASAGPRALLALNATWHGGPGRVGVHGDIAAAVAAAGLASHGAVAVDWQSQASSPVGMRARLTGLRWSEPAAPAWGAEALVTLLSTTWLPAFGVELGAAGLVSTSATAPVWLLPVGRVALRLSGLTEVAVSVAPLGSVTGWLTARTAPPAAPTEAPLRESGWRIDAIADFAAAAGARVAVQARAAAGYAQGQVLRSTAAWADPLTPIEQLTGDVFWGLLDIATGSANAGSGGGGGNRWRAKLRAVLLYALHPPTSTLVPELRAEVALLTDAVVPGQGFAWSIAGAWRPGPDYAVLAALHGADSADRAGAAPAAGARLSTARLPLHLAASVTWRTPLADFRAAVGAGWSEPGGGALAAHLGVSTAFLSSGGADGPPPP